MSAQSKTKLPPEISVKTVRRGDESSMTTPSEESERIKYRIEIKNDSAIFSIKAAKFKNGTYIYEEVLEDIEQKRKVFKGDIILFEMVPDVSTPTKMTLYSFFPDFTHFRYLNCSEGKRIKYKKFTLENDSKTGQVPMMICYVDDEQNNIEKLLKKYTKDDHITISSIQEIQDKILSKIELCLFVYYNQTPQ